MGRKVTRNICVRVRARNEVSGSRSPEKADGGAYALRLVLTSCILSLSDQPLSPHTGWVVP